MPAGQRTAQRFAANRQSFLLAQGPICTSCLTRIANQSRRTAATAAAAAAEPSISSSQDSPNPPVPNAGPRKAYQLLTSPVVSRPPLLTRDLTSFEKAFYLYQKRLNERLVLPFSRYFYYKKGTPGDLEWKRKARTRRSAARDIGMYSGYGDEAWNDEVLVGDKTAEPASIVEALIRDAEGKDTVEGMLVGDAEEGRAVTGDATEGEGERKPVGQDIVIEKPLTRATEADQKNDLRSLNRKLDRTLYLLVQNKDGHWRFPQDRVYGRENMHQAAERTLIQSAGINMNTWVVGSHPVGHFVANFAKPRANTISPNRLVSTSLEDVEQEEFGEKVFFMKVRLMGGKPDLSKNEYGDRDYRWLVKEEIAPLVHPKYWSWIRNMLAER